MRHGQSGSCILLDEKNSPPILCQGRDGGEDRLARLLVEPDRRLVEQDQGRIEHQGAGELDLLLLAAGERAGGCMATFGDDGEELGNPFDPASNQRVVGKDEGAHQHILPNRHAGEEAPILRHVNHAPSEPVLRRQAADVLAPKHHLAAGRSQKPADRLEDGRLSRTIGPDQAHDLAGFDGQIDALQDQSRAIPRRHAGEREDDRSFTALRFPSFCRVGCHCKHSIDLSRRDRRPGRSG